MNVPLVLSGLFGFFWGGFATPAAIKLARHFQILDLPDHRKIHKTQTPRGAGLTLWMGYLLWSLYFVAYYPSIRYSATGATLIFFSGYVDDMKSLSPFLRLAIHVAAATIAVIPFSLPPLAAFICVAWITGTTSAYNFVDGINGLCISVFIASATALSVIGAADFGVALAAMALGVFCWNFPMAQTFLGDGGSTLLGFLFSVHFVGVAAPLLGRAALPELILLLLLFGGVPVTDTLVAFSRRMLKGKSPFYPDRGHLHHRLLDLTHSPFWAVTCLLVLQILFLAAGTAVYFRLSLS